MFIVRHKTAIKRDRFSLPIRTAISRGLLKKNFDVLDYGCGHGDDVKLLINNGFKALGWDPHYSPSLPTQTTYDFVNLGFVLNVIEDPDERAQTLQKAYDYSNKVTLVSCMLSGDMNQKISRPFNDGFVSSAGTFQKYYLQSELREYIEQEIKVTAHAIGPGIFAIIKDPELLEDFEYLSLPESNSSHHRNRTVLKEFNFEILSSHKNRLASRKKLFTVSYDFFSRHARFPTFEEAISLNQGAIIHNELKHILLKLNQTLDQTYVTQVSESVQNELLKKFCIRKFIKLRESFPLTQTLKRDIRNLFKNQTNLKRKADLLLFELGNSALIKQDVQAAVSAKCGVTLNEKFIFHKRKLSELPLRLQTLIALANYLCGNFDEPSLYQIHLNSPKVSMLDFYDFENSAVPILKTRKKVDFMSNSTLYKEYSSKKNLRLTLLKSPFMSENNRNFITQKNFETLLSDQTKLLDTWRTWDVHEVSEVLRAEKIQIPSYC